MSKRQLLLGLLVVLAAAAIYVYLTDPEALPLPGAATRGASGSSQLPCAEYKEHRKNVDVRLQVPVLTDKRAPVYKVLEVIDGDTISVSKNGKTTVRLLAMDTPEKSTTRTGEVQYYGEEAYRYAKSLIEKSDGEVRLTYDETKTDKYGRDLAYVWLKDGRMLNAMMVADGYAYSYTASPKPEYVDLMLGLMRQAREQNLGLWGRCE